MLGFQFRYSLCWGTPRQPSALVIGWKASTQHVVMLMVSSYVLYERVQKQNQQREKTQGTKAGETWTQASKSPPHRVTRMCLIPPAHNCDMCEMVV